jgi:putative transcriptional regulator
MRRNGTKRGVNRAGARIIQGLTELREALREGVPLEKRFTVKTVEVPEPQEFDEASIRALRLQLGASQAVFARLIGVSRVLVQSWEQGLRKPSPLARRLLSEIRHDPRRWQRMLRKAA